MGRGGGGVGEVSLAVLVGRGGGLGSGVNTRAGGDWRNVT